jgi:hypothetical protein
MHLRATTVLTPFVFKTERPRRISVLLASPNRRE